MTAPLSDYKSTFIALAIEANALRFGQFVLKSGRISPYFFNSASFAHGYAIQKIGQCYAQAILAQDIAFDMLFGAAYKGIPLVVSAAIALSEYLGRSITFGFNRKSPKKHGEGGVLVGEPPKGRVLLIDDVMTAGTAILDVAAILAPYDAEIAAIFLALDRQECCSTGNRSAATQIATKLSTVVHSIVGFSDILDYIRRQGDSTELAALEAYRAQYAAD